MAVTKYTYSIANDTANGKVVISKLSEEIKATSDRDWETKFFPR